jgi:hypothetical protein
VDPATAAARRVCEYASSIAVDTSARLISAIVLHPFQKVIFTAQVAVIVLLGSGFAAKIADNGGGPVFRIQPVI